MRPGGDEVCPLCGAPGPFEPVPDMRKRTLRACGACGLVFAAAADLPEAAAERERYAKHRNSIDDAGYVAFLRQAIDPVLPLLTPDLRGLDYGCGHTPALHQLLAAAGLRCENYDLYFFPEWPEGLFDYVFATEVVEHFHHPAAEWPKLVSLLKPGALLIVMTAPWDNLAAFRTWGYASDETHVAFYHRQTLAWIFETFGLAELANPNPRVRVLQKR